jgi:hypothetical protein
MKIQKTKWIKDRIYEFYFSIDWEGFCLSVTIADVDFEIHLFNCRKYNKVDDE